MKSKRTLPSLIVALGLASAALGAQSAAASSPKPWWSFVSAPGLHPPKLQVLERKPGLARGDFVLAPGSRPGSHVQSGPLLVDSKGRPVWFSPLHRGAEDFEQETYEGKPVLVWITGGTVVVVNEQYRRVATLKAKRPWMIDGHAASIIGEDVWVVVVRQVGENLSAYGGPVDGSVIDSGLQEYDLRTGHLIQTWDALNPHGTPNVPLSASKQPITGTLWDAYHLNAVQPLPDGDLLFSMRNTWSVYLLDPTTDHILWTLGGKQSTFTVAKDAKFAWQHDANLVQPGQGGLGADEQLTLFNDNNSHAASEGMVLKLDTISDQATRVRAYHHHPPLHAVVTGSMELLPNGNALVGWGSEPYFSEYSSSGKELLNVRLPLAGSSYRALFTNAWVGTPYYAPSAALRGKTVYASWNGATEVAKWRVLAGTSTHDLKTVATEPEDGFETAIRLTKSYGVYEVRGLNSQGHVLGTSKSFT